MAKGNTSSFATRTLVRLLPITVVGPTAFYVVLYWWFVPDSMRFPIPASTPSTVIKILATILVIPMLFLSSHTAEALASSLPPGWATSWHRVIAPTSFAVNALSAIALILLFKPVAGFAPLSSVDTVVALAGLVLAAWLNLLTKGFAIFANVDASRRPPPEIVGPSASDLLKLDPRPPILYLRSFAKEVQRATTLGRFAYIRSRFGGIYFMAHRPRAADSLSGLLRTSLAREYKRKLLNSHRSTIDEQVIFAEYFSEFGPYIAIGKPGESAESMDLGAAKQYVPDEAWMEKIIDFIDKSAAILIDAAHSEGLVWELQQVLRRAPPQKVLLILPRTDPDYRDFRVFATHIFPQPFPEVLPTTRLLMFSDEWSPMPLEYASMVLEESVQPFVARIWPATSSVTVPEP